MKKKIPYFLILILLFFSGNPLISFLFGKFTPTIGLILTVILTHKSIHLDKTFLKLCKIVVIGIFLIAVFQYLELQSVSWLGMINLALKFLLGGVIINHLKEKFVWFFFKVVSDLSILSLFFYFFINIFKLPFPYISLGPEINSYIFYGTSNEIHIFKNAGMYWEPGAHAGILTLCLAVNFNYLKFYWRRYRYKLLAIIFALLTTQSTTGYLVGFVILFSLFIYGKRNVIFKIIVLPIIIISSIYVFQTTDFLNEKVGDQFEASQTQRVGEFSNTRFGSIIFDWHYIQKHPLIGNGIDEKTRYSDHKYLFIGEQGDIIGSGNGFTGALAAMGVFYILFYFYFLWKATVVNSVFFAFLILLVVFLNLQGEQWLNFPLYLGLPFLIIKPISIFRKINRYKKIDSFSRGLVKQDLIVQI
jgi:hypothetical protein